jgi:hypothetical protein
VQEDNLVEYKNPGMALPVADALTAVLRQGARELLAQAIETEVSGFLASHRELKDADGKQRVARTAIYRSGPSKPGLGTWR